MFRDSIRFSDNYEESLQYRDKINSYVVRAKEKCRGYKLFGKPIDLNNPDEVVALLYILSEDFRLFHE